MIEFISAQRLKRDIQELLVFLKVYIIDPIHYIKHPPAIHWQSGVTFIFALNIFLGLIRAVLSQSIISAIIGFIITPVLATTVMGLATLFLSYFFRLILNRQIPLQSLFIILLIAYVPGALFFFGSVLYAPLFILGVVVSAALLVVGLVENLQIPKKLVIQLVAVGCAIVLGFWLFQQIYVNHMANSPKSLDQLEEELRY